MKKIYACSKKKLPNILWYVIFAFFVIVEGYQILQLLQIIAYEGKKLPLILNIISYTLLIIMMINNRYFGCRKHYIEFDEDKILFQTRKNKKTEIPYKDIASHEIHIFEIIFHLKNGKKEVLNLDNFTYENIREIKETLLKKLG